MMCFAVMGFCVSGSGLGWNGMERWIVMMNRDGMLDVGAWR